VFGINIKSAVIGAVVSFFVWRALERIMDKKKEVDLGSS